MKHILTKKIYTEKVNFYNHYTDMEDLKANEECQLFPPRFILNVVKDPECTTTLNTDIIVTLYNIEERKTFLAHLILLFQCPQSTHLQYHL